MRERDPRGQGQEKKNMERYCHNMKPTLRYAAFSTIFLKVTRSRPQIIPSPLDTIVAALKITK